MDINTVLALVIQGLLTHYIMGNVRLYKLPRINKIPDKSEKKIVTDNFFHPRIAYGTEVSIEDYPYFASLEGCGGTIISDTWIVTAAHCVSELVDKSVWVGGESFDNSKKIAIDKIVVHPLYTLLFGLTPINDIALVKLSEPLSFNKKMEPLALPDDKSWENVVVFLKSWLGRKNELKDSDSDKRDGKRVGPFVDDEQNYLDNKNTSTLIGRGIGENRKINKKINRIELNLMPTSVCYKSLQHSSEELNMNLLDKFTICSVRVEDLPGAGIGDSGSPVMKDGKLVGIVSYAIRTPGHYYNEPIVFLVNVAYYVSWIKSVTGLK